MSATAIDSVEVFFAHALALEEDSAERYEDLADNMAVHNRPELEALFERLARYSHEHANEIRMAASGLDLPDLAAWEFDWPDAEPPETVCHDGMHYLKSPRTALTQALASEERGQAFYAEVASTSDNEAIAEAAAEFAAEEAEHVELLKRWIDSLPPVDESPGIDLDPPNEPE